MEIICPKPFFPSICYIRIEYMNKYDKILISILGYRNIVRISQTKDHSITKSTCTLYKRKSTYTNPRVSILRLICKITFALYGITERSKQIAS